MSDELKVTVLPEERELTCSTGTNLLQLLNGSGIKIKSVCGGDGSCRRCQVLISEGEYSLKNGSSPDQQESGKPVLACQVEVTGDLVVEVPRSTRLTQHQVLIEDEMDEDQLLSREREEEEELTPDPLFQRLMLKMEPPTMVDNKSDLERLQNALRQQTGEENYLFPHRLLKTMARKVRVNNWQVCLCWVQLLNHREVVQICPSRHRDTYGVAIDIGTTSVVARLFDLESGDSLLARGTYNQQSSFGDDVISRINYATNSEGGIMELHQAVIDTINQLLRELIEEQGIEQQEIKLLLCAGNTTMIHFLYQLDPNNIRKDPYIPTFSAPPPLRADELGLTAHPGARVFSYPSVGSFVGGDIVSGVLATGMAEREELSLLIDIGTNGEIVVGNSEFLMACSASAGPAFEGGGITCGMRAMEGAIERVEFSSNGEEVFCQTIGNCSPLGLCGTGLIDTIATMQKVGIIDRSGKFNTDFQTPRLRESDEGSEFVLVWAEQAGIDEDILLTTNDIKNLMRSKAAVYAGIRMLLKNLSLEGDMLQEIMIAGGFGNHLNLEASIRIGLLPDLPRERFRFIGNSSLKGASRALLSSSAFQRGLELAKMMTYLELSAEEQGADFMDEFVAAQFLPHTDLSLFPSLQEDNENQAAI